MACEKCSVCGELGTPWMSTPELGTGLHMCDQCSFDHRDFQTAFRRYLMQLDLSSDVNGDPLLKGMKPRTVKKHTYLLIRKWYNDRMEKK